MTKREIAVASNLELDKRYKYLSQDKFDDESWAEEEMFWIDDEWERRDDAAHVDRDEDSPCLDDPWWVHV